jgi:aspartyl-tRNA(Asn)/glutamyl-tRNA(Gln) amidotransferase subunit C
MGITKKDVEYISELARLTLTEEEKNIYQGQLKNILDWMEELNNADTLQIEPTAHVLGIANVFSPATTASAGRPDVPEKFKNRDAILNNAPEREFDFLKVKKVIE